MKVGAAQIHLYPDIEKNLKNIEYWMKKASDQGVDILNFPETSLTGYLIDDFNNIKQDSILSGIDRIASLARQSGVSAVVGTPYWIDDRLYNSVNVLLSDGRSLLYHKRRLVSYEERIFASGNELLTFDLNGLTFGTIICRDQNFPALAQSIKSAGAQVMFISCAHYYQPMEARLKVEKNRALPIVRAYENGMFVVKANAVGSYKGKINLGHSIIVGPNGVVLSEAGETNEHLLTYDIDALDANWSW